MGVTRWPALVAPPWLELPCVVAIALARAQQEEEKGTT
jgi:hypothetical protein